MGVAKNCRSRHGLGLLILSSLLISCSGRSRTLGGVRRLLQNKGDSIDVSGSGLQSTVGVHRRMPTPDCVAENLKKTCPVGASAQYTKFSLVFNVKAGSVCMMNPALVRGYFEPITRSPFILSLRRVATNQPTTKFCGVIPEQYDWSCARRRELEVDEDESRGLGAAYVNASSHQEAYRRRLATTKYTAWVSVYGEFISGNVDATALSAEVVKDFDRLIDNTYGATYNCAYEVVTDISPATGPPSRPTHSYDLILAKNTLEPDGYPFTGVFNDAGASFFGPTISVNEGDLVTATVTNDGDTPQATHWHGMNAEQYPYNDGAVGTSQGSLHIGSSYAYKFNAFPPGTTWYHGHMEYSLTDGNRGLLVVKKNPCHDPYPNLPEFVLGFTESMPWGYNDDATHSLRHITAVEDFNAFMNGQFDETLGPREADYATLLNDAGIAPTSEQPFAGVLINGKGRATPIDWNQGGARLGPDEGKYFTLDVTSGTTYRVRMVGMGSEWGWRIRIQNHEMKIIAISGSDIAPYTAPPEGVEMQPGERYDILLECNQAAVSSKHMIMMESIDGCYKSAAWILYDGYALTPTDEAISDVYQADRTCDADCYNGGPCDIGKAFASDRDFLKVTPLDYDAVPPANTAGLHARLVINAEGASKFILNSLMLGAVEPPLYKLHQYDPNFSALQMPMSITVARYSFRKGDVVDWCTVNYTPDRHPMHMHGTRFWILGAGKGSTCVNQIGEQKPTVRVDVLNTDVGGPNTPSWIMFRTRIDENGAFPYHCHLAYHQYKALLVPVISGDEDVWPRAPDDLPMGMTPGAN